MDGSNTERNSKVKTTRSNKQKLHILIEKEILRRILPIAVDEHSGNVSQYIRVTIFNDLIRRGMLTEGENRLLLDG